MNELLSYHTHRCANCGTCWGHARIARSWQENVAAHCCPSCGQLQWFVSSFPVMGLAAVAGLLVLAWAIS